MTAPDHLKITGPEDILGFIPHSLGYWPENSLVALTMQGKRLGATLRVDLPGPGIGSRGAADFAATVASYLAADDEADGTLLAFFTGPDDDGVHSGDDAVADLLAGLELALEESRMPVRDAWIIGAQFWRNAYCSDPACCVQPGRPVEEIRNSRLNAEMIFRGSTVGAAPGAAGLSPRREDAASLETERRWAEQFSGRRRDHGQFAQVMEVWSRVLAAPPGPALSPELSAYLCAALGIQAWRDAVLVMAAAGRLAAERGAEDFGLLDDDAGLPGAPEPTLPPPLDGFPPLEVSPPLPHPGTARAGIATGTRAAPSYGDVLLGLAPSVPDWALMARLERVLVQLGGDAGDEARAACLTARGWIEWCRGKGSFADALFRQAAQVFPGYRLAELLAELAGRGTICGWAARREAAWQKIEPGAA